MSDQFEYDVFLSHASADKPAVRELAERLKRDGLRVWFDEWVIQPGDSIPLAIEQCLESSRTLIQVMSKSAFASASATLERHTALFGNRHQLRHVRGYVETTQWLNSIPSGSFEGVGTRNSGLN